MKNTTRRLALFANQLKLRLHQGVTSFWILEKNKSEAGCKGIFLIKTARNFPKPLFIITLEDNYSSSGFSNIPPVINVLCKLQAPDPAYLFISARRAAGKQQTLASENKKNKKKKKLTLSWQIAKILG